MRFNFPCNYADARAARTSVVEEVERHRYPPDTVFAVKLAFEEAVIAVVKDALQRDSYAHRGNADGEITVDVTVTQDWVDITISADDRARTFRVPRDQASP